MAVTHLPPAGWYADPEDANSERFWSGAEWSDEKRERPVASPSILPPPSVVLPLPGDAATGTSESPATPTKKKHWRLFNPPLEEVVEELRSHDTATRVAAAALLRFYKRRRYSDQRLEAEIACLSDPVPAVRYNALLAMVTFKADREWIVSLLVSDQEADAEIKASVLAGIAGIGGPDSPVPNWLKKAMTKVFLPVINSALHRANSAVMVLPILELARTADSPPTLFTPWVNGKIPAFGWPDRCCVCGTPSPGRSEYLPYHREWTSSGHGRNEYEIITTRTVASGGLMVPVCSKCQPPAPPDVDEAGLRMKFPSPEFVAALLYHDTWSIS